MCKGSICGGVITMSQLMRDIKKYGPYAGMMAFVMPDHIMPLYKKFKHSRDKIDQKIAEHIFERWAVSQI